MSAERFALGEVRTGPAYEAARLAERARLAATAGARRVRLADDLVLVFETRERVRAALEESLRYDRVAGDDRIAAEAAAFAELAGGPHTLAAILYVDLADPVELAERVAALAGVAAAVYLEAGGTRVAAHAGPEPGDGAVHLRFEPGPAERVALLDAGEGEVMAGVDHQACRARVALSADQVRALTADLQR